MKLCCGVLLCMESADIMDVVDYRDGLRMSAGKMRWFQETGRCKATGLQGEAEDGEEELVEVLLKGRVPRGFSLRGEHREPLVSTKVEEGGEAAVSLQAGDEMVSINAVPLSGSRHEAVCLVRSSHNSLALVVRRSVKMVDIVSPRTMQSESEVHVARSFLTKILRSSMRKNERPHSWHASKLTEEEAEPAVIGPSPTPVWQPKHEARPSTKDLSNQGDHTSLRQFSSQLSSVTNMERIERPSCPFPPARLSPTKFTSSPEPLCGGVGKRDSGFNCFTSSASPPVPDPGKGTSAEKIFYKGLQNAGPQGERPRYLQPPLGNGGWEGPRAEEQPGCRFSNAGRANVCPVWHVPERKKAQSPPPPPLRSDSFAATKVFPYSDRPGGHHAKNQGRGADRLSEANDHCAHKPHHEKGLEARLSYNPPPKKDLLHPSSAADCNHNQVHPNKLFSLSSNDVRQMQSSFVHLPNHQRQYSDESPFYLPRSVPAAKPQSVGSYYRSLQDLPTKAANRNQVRHSTASLTGSGTENGGHSKYNGIAAKQLGQPAEPQTRQGKAEGYKGDTETPHWANGFVSSLTSINKTKYSLPESQLPYTDSKERNGHSRLGNGLLQEHSGMSGKSSSSEDSQKRGERHPNDVKRHSPSHQDLWVPQDDHRISPQKTPLLHSLTQESRSLAERHPAANAASSTTATQDTADPVASGSGKACRRSDRFATTLRNEIQLKRSQLQKSRSAATLTCCGEEEEAVEGWSSKKTSTTSSDSSFSTTYKDHLKEAQARVLQATSFQRRDLEPTGVETPLGKPGSTTSGQLSRIGGRKRFPLNKRLHSFSEPDMIDKVGVEGEPQTGSFGERRKFFEAKPAFSRPLPKPGQANPGVDPGEGTKAQGKPQKGHPQGSDSDCLSPGSSQVLLEQQRLGTFAEYQATWSLQRKTSEAKAQGRYHSAENILDADAEEKVVCIHERSRSSPSSDFYAQSIPVPWRDPVENSYMELRHGQQTSSTGINRGPSEGRLRCQPSPLDQHPQPAQLVPRSNTSQTRDGPLPGLSDHRPRPEPASPSHTTVPAGAPNHHSSSPGSQHPAQPSQNKGLLPQSLRPHLGPVTTSSSSSSSSSQEFLPGAQAEPATIHQPQSSPEAGARRDATVQGSPACPAPAISPCSWKTDGPSDAGEELGKEEERAQPLATTKPPPPPPPPPSSSPLSSKTTALSVPSADGTRSPSPQFTPQRLTDKPPPAAVSAQDDDPTARPGNGTSEAMDVNCPVRKVPVKIVHTESSSEREGRGYLAPSEDVPATSEGPRPLQLAGWGCSSSGQPASLFSAYTCQGPPRATPTGDAQLETPPDPGRRSAAAHPGTDHGTTTATASAGTERSEEDAKREELARDIMDKDKSLADILDQSRMKTTMDLMKGLFPQGEQLLVGAVQRRRASTTTTTPRQATSPSSPRNPDERRDEDGVCASASLVPSSSYYSTSAPKAELLIKMKDMQEQLDDEDCEDELDIDLAGKKQELISSLAQKLEVLREARYSLQEDVEDNEALGREVEATVQLLCQPNQLDKFRMFVGDLDKVVSLLLSLSGRLARVENALNGLEDEAPPEEKRTLTEKRKLLMRQHEDAKELKENLDRRERLVSGVMEAHLDGESLADYRHFVKMKSALIIEQRKLEDKIKLGEEQLKCLVDSLPLEQRVLF